jgi:hypothetical protein
MIKWERGQYHGVIRDGYRPFDYPDVQADELILKNVNPDTPIDPEGWVGYWMVPNYPVNWIVASVGFEAPDGTGRRTHWLLEFSPLRHLKWTGGTHFNQAKVISTFFRPRNGWTLAYYHEEDYGYGPSSGLYRKIAGRFRKIKKY